MGWKTSSAPSPTALRFTADRETLQLDVSKVALGNAPHFDANQWPDFAQANYSTGVYRAYRVEPYFTNNGATRPNTAARTPRAPEDRTPTTVDRPNTHSDTDITAHIRREIIAAKDMSRNGRNVRIITDKGQVTLRGR
mgnify:CR=1 FL=1